MITFDCSSCGRTLKVGDQHAGKRVKCSGCAQVVPIPAAIAAIPGQAGAPPAARKSLAAPPRAEMPADTQTLPPLDPAATVDQPTRSGGDKPLASAAPPITIPGYEIQEVLGRGAMGVIYLARQLQPRRLVALKMILAGDHANAEQLARFHAEAELAARLQHPNIVTIHEVGQSQGRPFLTLEYVAGGNLAGYLKEHKRLKPKQAAELVHQLARAVQFAHKRGVLHRDLKPANIVLAPVPEGEDGPLPWVPKITDFGLAKPIEGMAGAAGAGPKTRTGAIVGTPQYMPPEQVKAKKGQVGPAADVYSLGAVLYELLTGRAPFEGPTTLDVLLQVAAVEPKPPRRLRPKLPRDLETICLKCLEKDPARRYASAQELAEDLRRFLDGEPIRARPQGMLERARRFVKRRKELAFLVGGGLLALCLSVGVLAVWWPFGSAEKGSKTATEPQRKSQLPPDLQLISQDEGIFVSVRVADLLKQTRLKIHSQQIVQDVPLPPEIMKYVKALEQQGKEFEKATGFRQEDVERMTMSISVAKLLEQNQGGVRSVSLLSRPYDWDKWKPAIRKMLPGPLHDLEHLGKKALGPRQGPGVTVCAVSDRIVLSTDEDFRPILDQYSEALEQDGHLRQAVELAAAGKHHLVVAFNPARKDLSNMFKGKPAWQALAELDCVTLTLNLSTAGADAPLTGVKAELVIAFPDADSADRGTKAAQAMLAEFLATVKKLPELQEVPGLKKIVLDPLAAAAWQQEGSTARLPLQFQWQPSELKTLVAVLGKKLNEGIQEQRAQLNLKMLAFAMYSYHDLHKQLPPPAIYDKSGKPLLSWRVALLPYLEQDALYKQFHLNEPWDSPHNWSLVNRMPDVYKTTWLAGQGATPEDATRTHYQVITGKGTLFEGPQGSPLAMLTGPQGTSNTPLVVEAAQAVPWTKPEDLDLDAGPLLPRLGRQRDGFHIILADTTPYFLLGTIPEATLRQLVLLRRGQRLDVSKYSRR